jgi:hypothetical protein
MVFKTETIQTKHILSSNTIVSLIEMKVVIRTVRTNLIFKNRYV